ncbi:MAG: hypothetical protein ACQESM_05470 [Bacteroidota bacterium]
MTDSYPIESLVPKPFLLNGLKHHLPLIQRNLPVMKQLPEHDFLKTLKKTGNSVTDFYYGTMDIDSICNELKTKLVRLKAFEKEAYYNWIIKQDPYFCFRISDGSNWLMRKGNQNERYIHIHPGKHSHKTKRLKSRSLRIALSMIYFSKSDQELFSLDFLNQIRRDKLNLPPVKALSNTYKWLIFKLTDH